MLLCVKTLDVSFFWLSNDAYAFVQKCAFPRRALVCRCFPDPAKISSRQRHVSARDWHPSYALYVRRPHWLDRFLAHCQQGQSPSYVPRHDRVDPAGGWIRIDVHSTRLQARCTRAIWLRNNRRLRVRDQYQHADPDDTIFGRKARSRYHFTSLPTPAILSGHADTKAIRSCGNGRRRSVPRNGRRDRPHHRHERAKQLRPVGPRRVPAAGSSRCAAADKPGGRACPAGAARSDPKRLCRRV